MEVAADLFPICHGRATLNLISSTYGFTCGPIFLSLVCFCFCFLERMWSCLILWVLCVFFSNKIYGFMGCWRLAWLLFLWVCFSGLFMIWFLGFIFCFSGFDGDWIWLLDLDLGFARDWFVFFLDLGRTWRIFLVSI